MKLRKSNEEIYEVAALAPKPFTSKEIIQCTLRCIIDGKIIYAS